MGRLLLHRGPERRDAGMHLLPGGDSAHAWVSGWENRKMSYVLLSEFLIASSSGWETVCFEVRT